MVLEFIYNQFLGLPLLMWGGIFGALILIATAIAGKLAFQGKINVKTHMILAGITILIALIHGLAALISYLTR